MKTIAIIQARIGSSRLPGKVLKKICNKTVLEHVIDRLNRIKNIDRIVIATTALEKDIVIVEEAKRLGITYFRGSEEDVLSRYYYAAKENEADIVVRITSDCPLIDSEISDKIIQFYLDNMDKFDYVSNTIERTYPRGLDTEVFSFTALEKAFNEAVSKRDKEHVTPYIWDNPKKFRIFSQVCCENYSNFRWTLDTEDDFKLISSIYELLYKNFGNNFRMMDIIELYKNNENLVNINSNVRQKEI